MTQPSFDDMGKSCRDFFKRGFFFNLLKVDVENKIACNSIDSNATGTFNREDKASLGEFEARGCIPEYGTSLRAKWDTNNILTGGAIVKDKILKGLQVLLDGQQNIDTGMKTAGVMVRYGVDCATFDIGISGGDEANLLLKGSLVMQCKEFLAAYQFKYDLDEQALKASNVAMAYNGLCNGLSLYGTVENSQSAYAAMKYKINNCWEAGVEGSYTTQQDVPVPYTFAVASRYRINECTAFKSKLDTEGKVGIGYEITATPGAKMTLCALLDANNFSNGTGHKAGLALEFGKC